MLSWFTSVDWKGHVSVNYVWENNFLIILLLFVCLLKESMLTGPEKINPETVFQDIFHMGAQQPKFANYCCTNSEKTDWAFLCVHCCQKTNITLKNAPKKPDFGLFAKLLPTDMTQAWPSWHHTVSERKIILIFCKPQFSIRTFLPRSSIDEYMSEESSSSSETSRLSLLWLQLADGGWRRASSRASPRASRWITCRRV